MILLSTQVKLPLLRVILLLLKKYGCNNPSCYYPIALKFHI